MRRSDVVLGLVIMKKVSSSGALADARSKSSTPMPLVSDSPSEQICQVRASANETRAIAQPRSRNSAVPIGKSGTTLMAFC